MVGVVRGVKGDAAKKACDPADMSPFHAMIESARALGISREELRCDVGVHYTYWRKELVR